MKSLPTLRFCIPRVLVFLAGAIWASAAMGTTITSLPIVANGSIGNVVDSGQSFTVPSGSASDLLSFTTYLVGLTTGGPGTVIKYDASIYQFNATSSQTVGAPLYTSGTITAPPAAFPITGTTFDFSASPIQLTPGGTYLFVFAQDGFGNQGNLAWGFSDNYSAGKYYATYSTAPYSGGNWFDVSYDPNLDIGFTATFVPEPGSVVTLIFVASLLAYRRRNAAGDMR